MSKKKAKPVKQVKPANPYMDKNYDTVQKLNLNINRNAPYRKILLAYARKCLELLKENIRTNKGGTWKRVQWGLKAGQLALQGTEDQWKIESPPGSRIATLQPIDAKRPMWRGHIQGSLIKPKKPGGFLWFTMDDGSRWRLRQVKLPKRDPRPSRTQLMYLDRSV